MGSYSEPDTTLWQEFRDRKQYQAVLVGGVSLEAVPAAREDDAETASIIVNGRKGLYEHGHSGGPAVPVRCLGFVLGGKVQGSPRAGAQSRGKLSASAETAVALLSSWITNEAE